MTETADIKILCSCPCQCHRLYRSFIGAQSPARHHPGKLHAHQLLKMGLLCCLHMTSCSIRCSKRQQAGAKAGSSLQHLSSFILCSSMREHAYAPTLKIVQNKGQHLAMRMVLGIYGQKRHAQQSPGMTPDHRDVNSSTMGTSAGINGSPLRAVMLQGRCSPALCQHWEC